MSGAGPVKQLTLGTVTIPIPFRYRWRGLMQARPETRF